MEYVQIISLWAAYCAFHSYLISTRFTGLMARLLKRYYAFYRLVYVLISVALLIPLIRYSSQLDSHIVVMDGVVFDVVRKALTLFSLGAFFWAFFFDYDPLSFFGIRQILNLRKTTMPPPSLEIKKKGLLGIIRHPMYLSLIVYLWCQTYTLAEIITNTVLTIYVIIGTILEERKLVLEYGDAYVQYQHEVPMLLPFAHVRRSSITT
jgi:protein-S-isoprenylcysteine O-methyltransferase Ste14